MTKNKKEILTMKLEDFLAEFVCGLPSGALDAECLELNDENKKGELVQKILLADEVIMLDNMSFWEQEAYEGDYGLHHKTVDGLAWRKGDLCFGIATFNMDFPFFGAARKQVLEDLKNLDIHGSDNYGYRPIQLSCVISGTFNTVRKGNKESWCLKNKEGRQYSLHPSKEKTEQLKTLLQEQKALVE